MKARTGVALVAAVMAGALTVAPAANAAGFQKKTLHFDVVVGRTTTSTATSSATSTRPTARAPRIRCPRS